jgi:hypothetical protein
MFKFMITFASCFTMRQTPGCTRVLHGGLSGIQPRILGMFPTTSLQTGSAFLGDATILALSYTNISIWSVHPTLGATVRSHLLHSFLHWDQQSDHIYYTLFFIESNSQITFITLFSSGAHRCCWTIMISQNHFPEPYRHFFFDFSSSQFDFACRVVLLSTAAGDALSHECSD